MAITTRRGARVAWIVCAMTFALLAVGAAMLVATWSVPLRPFLIPRGVNLLVAPVYAIVGAVLVSRVPKNALGPVFLYTSVGGAGQIVSEQVAFGAEVWPTFVPAAPWALAIFFALANILALPPTLLLLALFPTGRLQSLRGKWAVAVGIAASLGAIAAGSTFLERFPEPFSKYANPLAPTDPGDLVFMIGVLSFGVYAIALGVVLFDLMERFRRSHGVERQQLKWFAYAAALTGGTVALIWVSVFGAFATGGRAVFDATPDEFRAMALLAIPVFDLLPIAVAVAVLRYRLYDIDILINRTVLYVSVTAILAAAFGILSALSQRAVEAITGQRSDLVTIALVLLVALGFAPLRRRVQPLVDQLLPGRGLLTLLFTDIVGSTERVVTLGDERWRTVLEAYRAAVRRELARFGGREVDTAGDGFFATFERPAQAVRCAVALRDALRALGLDSRIGLHVGECELRGERVSGLNVIVAARIMATANANEIVVSRELRDIAATEFAFSERGTESLKGVPGEWPLSMVAGAV